MLYLVLFGYVFDTYRGMDRAMYGEAFLERCAAEAARVLGQEEPRVGAEHHDLVADLVVRFRPVAGELRALEGRVLMR